MHVRGLKQPVSLMVQLPQQALVERMRVKPFSIAVDGSSDNGLEKMNPLTVRVISDSVDIIWH